MVSLIEKKVKTKKMQHAIDELESSDEEHKTNQHIMSRDNQFSSSLRSNET